MRLKLMRFMWRGPLFKFQGLLLPWYERSADPTVGGHPARGTSLMPKRPNRINVNLGRCRGSGLLRGGKTLYARRLRAFCVDFAEVYAGAGVVEGSKAEEEYKEISSLDDISWLLSPKPVGCRLP